MLYNPGMIRVLTILLILVSVTVGFAQTEPKTVLRSEWTAEYLKFKDEASAAFKKSSAKVDAEFNLADHDRWEFAQSTGQLIFFNKAGKKVVAADVQIAGTWAANHSWMWAWNNDSLDPSLKKDMSKVRDFGREKNFYELITPVLTVDPDYAWTLTAVAGGLIKARSAYRVRNGNGYIYFLITDLKWVN